MKRLIALSAVAGLFLIGAVSGALGMHLYHALHGGDHGGSRSAAAHHEYLANLLELTPEQRQEVDQILEDAHPRARELHDEMLPRVHAHMQRIHQRILEVLTPEQREKFAELVHDDRGNLERLMLTHPGHGIGHH